LARILVIEDVAAVLLSIRIIVAGAGHEVTCAADGKQGLRLLAAQPFDLVISDIWMPVLSGKEVIAQGRKLAPGAKFLAITGGNPNSGAPPERDDPILGSSGAGSNIGADAVLYKPFEKADLLGAIKTLLGAAHG
jgi:CheY-like chemotaxis protein